MDEILYVLKVIDDPKLKQAIATRLMLDEAPAYVRLSVVAPLSNFGYPEDGEGAVLLVNKRGVAVGIKEQPEVPRAFVAWGNISYLADAADLGPG